MRQSRKLNRLTTAQVRSLGPGQHHDGGGLYLFKKTKHNGSWVYRFGTRNMGLGSMSTVSLAAAREKARECRELRAAGLDPKVTRDTDLLAARSPPRGVPVSISAPHNTSQTTGRVGATHTTRISGKRRSSSMRAP